MIAIIVPAYNEATVLSTVLAGIERALIGAKITHQIIVVDDCSSDSTATVARKTGAHVIRHLFNAGSGGATATGLRYAATHGFTMAATIDADGQHHVDDLVRGIRLMQASGGDLLIGSRLKDPAGMPLLKIVGNKLLSVITRLIFGVGVSDSQSGLRIFSQRALHGLRWRTNGYGFCSEMLWRAKKSALHIAEFPIQSIYTEYSQLKGQNNWNAVLIVHSLLKCRLYGIFDE